MLVLGAGFGGLELATVLSERLGERVHVTLIDRSDAFVFGFSKLDVMFGLEAPGQVRMPYADLAKPGVEFRRETIARIEPGSRRVTTDRGRYEGDVIVIALGADYDFASTPGLRAGENEFYTWEGALALGRSIGGFRSGSAVVGVCGAPFKCPPAPSEAALLLHDHLRRRGVRGDCSIALVLPFGSPIPVSPKTSRALTDAFAMNDIKLVTDRSVGSIDPARRCVTLDDGREIPCDLFLGVPKHVAPTVVEEAGLTQEGWVPVNPRNLATEYPGVYAIGDVTGLEVPMAGLFAEGAARTAALSILADLGEASRPPPYDGAGACYVEFGGGMVGRTDVNFLGGPDPTADFFDPSARLAAEKRAGAAERRDRWFGPAHPSPSR